MAVKRDIANIRLAAEGKKKIEWAERSMPVLRLIRERFAGQKPLKGVNMACCLHVTTETANLMRTLKAGGANVALCASNANKLEKKEPEMVPPDDKEAYYATLLAHKQG